MRWFQEEGVGEEELGGGQTCIFQSPWLMAPLWYSKSSREGRSPFRRV